MNVPSVSVLSSSLPTIFDDELLVAAADCDEAVTGLERRRLNASSNCWRMFPRLDVVVSFRLSLVLRYIQKLEGYLFFLSENGKINSFLYS